MEGPNIAEWQAQQQHQEAAGEKSGFGLGHGDFIATLVDGMKWLFNFHEGAIAAYSNVFEGLVNGSSLATLFGKSGNMFGIKFLEAIAEYFSGSGDESSGSGDGGDENNGINQGDLPLTDEAIANTASGLNGVQDLGDHQGYASPDQSPSRGDDHGHELSAPAG